MAQLPKSKSVDYRNAALLVQELNMHPGRGDTTTVTQTTNRSTGVTINATVGQITTDATSLGAGLEVKFVVTNDRVTAKSVIIVNAAGGQTADTSFPLVVAVTDGAFTIQLTNLSAATADTGAMVINFIVIGGN